jgi:HAD superfamily hydrolase (TIGR01549 family)
MNLPAADSRGPSGVEVVLFDLFGTVVHFAPHVPTAQVAGRHWRTAMGWLRASAEHELPQVQFDDFLTALLQVTEELVRQRPPEYREVPSRERFRRALVRCGVDAAFAVEPAERLSAAHMLHLAAQTLLPGGHAAVLGTLSACYRLGLISNFDHAPTARRILTDHGIMQFFEAIVISDEFGRRKPHPAIFEAALRTMGATADRALFVGDSVSDDVVGAHNAHLAVAWFNPSREPLPAGIAPPRYVITQLDELVGLLRNSVC